MGVCSSGGWASVDMPGDVVRWETFILKGERRKERALAERSLQYEESQSL